MVNDKTSPEPKMLALPVDAEMRDPGWVEGTILVRWYTAHWETITLHCYHEGW